MKKNKRFTFTYDFSSLCRSKFLTYIIFFFSKELLLTFLTRHVHSLNFCLSWWCHHSPRARHPEIWIQVGLTQHDYKQSQWRWWNSSWAISNPKRWCCESAALNMPAILESSAVAIGLEKVSFHSNTKERQCQRMLKLPYNCPHLTR